MSDASTPSDTRIRPWTRRFRYGWIAEAALGAGVYFLYDDIRERVAGSAHLALANARDLIRWEQAVGLYRELWIQRAFIDAGWFISFWNIYYGTIHFAMPVLSVSLDCTCATYVTENPRRSPFPFISRSGTR